MEPNTDAIRWEEMLPDDLLEAIRRRPVCYLAFGCCASTTFAGPGRRCASMPARTGSSSGSGTSEETTPESARRPS